ncbi:hypothetical protein [Demequina rhizosphaerae]|uniref:hypothetical protein n=1 Tax=Demequina rhizosphaerae TaxID=1638985 RepID=UPI000781C5D5|nr:hypothetical protein [Demequina rhizosphaerae]
MSGAYGLPDDAVVRSSWDDALERGGEMLVLAGNDVTLLSPVATEAALAARDGISVGDLRRHLLDEFGAPPEGEVDVLVQGLVDTLIARGVFRIESAA